MRGKRSKQYRKLMQQYQLHFGFREPYQVLVDGAILQDAARFKMDFTGGLSKALHGQIKPMITQCCIRHLYESEPKDSIVVQHAKAFERRRCNHHELEKPLSAFECINSVLDPKGTKNNKFRYVVACQDERIRAYLRTIPGVPLIYLKRSVMIMEPMPGVTEEVREREEKLKFRAGLKGRRNPGQVASKEGSKSGMAAIADASDPSALARIEVEDSPATAKDQDERKKRKRGPSGPNPLSMKKPKARMDEDETEPIELPTAVAKNASNEGKRKRKRRHKTSQEDGTTAMEAVETEGDGLT